MDVAILNTWRNRIQQLIWRACYTSNEMNGGLAWLGLINRVLCWVSHGGSRSRRVGARRLGATSQNRNDTRRGVRKSENRKKEISTRQKSMVVSL